MAGTTGIDFALSLSDKGVLSTLDSLMLKMTGLEGVVNLLAKGASFAADAFKKFVDVLQEMSDASAIQERSLVQLGAALQATGKDAQVSVRHIASIAAELQKVTKFGDEMTIEASKWFAQMPRLDPMMMEEYMASAQDMAEVMGVDLRIAAQVLARALEDPRRASRALRRANIMLSTEERRMLEIFDDVNDMASAQAVIMNAVEASVGGAAEKMASTLEGLRGQIRGIAADMQEHGGKIINQFIHPVTQALKEAMEDWSTYFGDMYEESKKGTESIQDWLDRVDQLSDANIEHAFQVMNAELTDFEKTGAAAAEGLSLISESAMKATDRVHQLNGELALGKKGAIFAHGFKFLAQLGEEPARERIREQLLAEQARRRQERIRKLEAQYERERLREEADAAQAKLDKEKEIEREKERIRKREEDWVERMMSKTMGPQERILEDLRKINELHEKDRATEEERLRITKALKDEYRETLKTVESISNVRDMIRDSDSDMADAMADIDRINEKIAKRDAKADKKKDFSATVTSLQGLYDRMLAGAASRKEKDPVSNELEKQRDDAQKQFNEAQRIRREQQALLMRLVEIADEEEAEMESRFGRGL